ncbi:MAG: phenylalanine--tRNA ligase subunit beta [Candidatus Paceibacterota bacterium]
MKVSYNWLQNYFEERLPDPEKLADGIIFHSFEVESLEKVGDDVIFDIKVLPDRAHDCLSHWGIAKEVKAIFNLKLKEKEYKNFKSVSTNLNIKIESEKCFRYMGRIIRNIKIEKSPDWLKNRLETIGQKSINNIVDTANFVMFDLGQPIHCFDLDKLESEKIIIRNGKTGERITTLDKKEINLDESILVIADGSTGSPQANEVLAIAGIKGGMKAEVDNNTKNIIIEVANFDAVSIRKTSKKIGILTDAVKRYENEISPELCFQVMNEITNLILDIAGGNIEEIVDIYPKKLKQNTVFVSVEYINKRLGTYFLKEEIESVWEKLGFEYEEENGEFKILVPLLRIDITGPHDLAEDVIKILGYERIEGKLPKIEWSPKMNEKFYNISVARNKLLNDGYSEVMTYSFRNGGNVEVLASASDKNFLRINLTDGLEESLKLNQLNAPFLGMKEIKIFEIGTVFDKNKEMMHVAYGDNKNIVETSLENFVSEKIPTDYFDKKVLPFIDLGQNFEEQKFKPWSIYPFISRDIAVWIREEESSETLKKLLIENATELLVKEPFLFDSFTKEGKTSYAFRLVFQSFVRTLKDEEINEIMAKISHKISENSSWQIR